MTDKAYAVPLHELLASVPREARLVIDDDDGMGTRFIPVGRYCNEAAEALRARLAQPEPEELARLEQAMIEAWKPIPQREWQRLTDEEMMMIYGQSHEGKKYSLGSDIEAKLKEKNHAV